MDNLISRSHKSLGQNPYGYVPELAAGIAYVVCFAILTILHLGLAIRYRYWIVLCTLVPGEKLITPTVEIIGWAGRLWSHYDISGINPFIMQICCLILGPAFFSAWAYTLLGYCITRLGPGYSLLKPKMYIAVFVTADVISLVLQAIGGGGAAVAAEDGNDTKKSTKIMLAGILFQLATMTIFVALSLDFIVRVLTHRPWRQEIISEPEVSNNGENVALKTIANRNGHNASTTSTDQYLLAGVAFASLMIFVRGIYRSVELAQGWSGYVISHEPFFIWLDGFPMVLCLAGLAVAHPGWLLPPQVSGWKMT
ncbi:RTA1 like protein-domain-containing protein [Naematelia encephala]|uniref:RTA1 like protein-domain-containing protein n=1 Tax=Naematelia encephala TaxID=71784 RepID=A0A1Y2AU03_9TREE|nr:RTA1 like protein-domain-containing protein [Naematelia encephala]